MGPVFKHQGAAVTMARITILNGPNLNLLGTREPEIYGTTTLAAIEKSCRSFADDLKIDLTFQQSNHEGVIVDWVQEAGLEADALIINPAGLSFRSFPLIAALKTVKGPVVELHVSNIHTRDELHRHPIVSSVADAVVCGLGAYGYIVALQAAARLIDAIPAGFAEPVRVGPV